VTPGTGRVVQVRTDGTLQPVATGLTFPTGMAVGSDGKLYVANKGFGLPPGSGEIVKIDPTAALPAILPTTGGNFDSFAVMVLAGMSGLLLIVLGFLIRRHSTG